MDEGTGFFSCFALLFIFFIFYLLQLNIVLSLKCFTLVFFFLFLYFVLYKLLTKFCFFFINQGKLCVFCSVLSAIVCLIISCAVYGSWWSMFMLAPYLLGFVPSAFCSSLDSAQPKFSHSPFSFF